MTEPTEYFLEFYEATWELFTLRGSKGRTRHVIECRADYEAARRYAIATAQSDRKGAVLTICQPGGKRQVLRFRPCV